MKEPIMPTGPVSEARAEKRSGLYEKVEKKAQVIVETRRFADANSDLTSDKLAAECKAYLEKLGSELGPKVVATLGELKALRSRRDDLEAEHDQMPDFDEDGWNPDEADR